MTDQDDAGCQFENRNISARRSLFYIRDKFGACTDIGLPEVKVAYFWRLV